MFFSIGWAKNRISSIRFLPTSNLNLTFQLKRHGSNEKMNVACIFCKYLLPAQMPAVRYTVGYVPDIYRTTTSIHSLSLSLFQFGMRVREGGEKSFFLTAIWIDTKIVCSSNKNIIFVVPCQHCRLFGPV